MASATSKKRPQTYFNFNLRQMGWIAVVIISLTNCRNKFLQADLQSTLDRSLAVEYSYYTFLLCRNPARRSTVACFGTGKSPADARSTSPSPPAARVAGFARQKNHPTAGTACVHPHAVGVPWSNGIPRNSYWFPGLPLQTNKKHNDGNRPSHPRGFLADFRRSKPR